MSYSAQYHHWTFVIVSHMLNSSEEKRPRQHSDHMAHKHSVDGVDAFESFSSTKLIVLSVNDVVEEERRGPHHDSKGNDEHRVHARLRRAAASHLTTQREAAPRTKPLRRIPGDQHPCPQCRPRQPPKMSVCLSLCRFRSDTIFDSAERTMET